ncbi:hypothetical protein [Maridesulfovibrio salexigens]|uniref:Uncharacterized protein n=1 Tax=Maridesulfovibrio salexigens (strain ATCC 14822 / DSM 2638 / NCIMB 8403 / VKM B-1763) TaxID=526222 RepID=C6BRP6_MARSD|nr:hypothetical protein [Maridesulfovibrio salexigens]ACS79486.1 hypothetical protein Desal_1424 [Maridesulfovibrio salexigens DSM 2638]
MFELSFLNIGVLICGGIATFAIYSYYNLELPKMITTFVVVFLVFMLLAHYTSWFSYVVGLVVVLAIFGVIGSMQDGNKGVKRMTTKSTDTTKPERKRPTPKNDIENARMQKIKAWDDAYYAAFYDSTVKHVMKMRSSNVDKIQVAPSMSEMAHDFRKIQVETDLEHRRSIAKEAVADALDSLGYTYVYDSFNKKGGMDVSYDVGERGLSFKMTGAIDHVVTDFRPDELVATIEF